MPTRIDSLTSEQCARFGEWADKWKAIGLSTEPADRAKFEAAVAECYRCTGLEPPKRVVWTTSPLALAFAGSIASGIIARMTGASVDASVDASVRASVDASVDASVRDSVDASVDASVRDSVRDSVGASVGASVDASVRDSVGASVDASVDASVRASVDASVRASVDASPSEQVRKNWHRYIGGQFWVGGWYWGSPAWVSFFTDVCGLDLGPDMMRRARAYRETAESACWWWPHKDFVLVSERPRAIHRDDQGRLHHESEAAISWVDGWGVYSWHGTRVPADIITHPEAITIERIEAEANQEIRRVMVARFGRERFIREGGFSIQHEDKDRLGFGRRLLRKAFSDGRVQQFVEVHNSSLEPDGSRRVYHLRVHPELRPLFEGRDPGDPQALTCHNAVASTFGMRGDEYAPAVET